MTGGTVNIARINGDGIVINVEIADAEWLGEERTRTADALIPYTDDNPAHIGLSWDPVTGFEQPPQPPDAPTILPAIDEGNPDDRPDA